MSGHDGSTEDAPADEAPPSLSRLWTWLAALAGAGLLAASAVDVIGGDGGAEVVGLAMTGAFLVLAPVVFHEAPARALGGDACGSVLARTIADLGAPDTARRIDRWGDGLAEAAAACAAAHTLLDGTELLAARRRLDDHLARTAAASALVQQYDATELRSLFRGGPPVVRTLVLGLMTGDPSLADADTIEAAVTESRTANEQYQGLRLARKVGPRLVPEDRRRLRAAIAADPMVRTDRARTTLSAEVLVLLGEDAPEPTSRDGVAVA